MTPDKARELTKAATAPDEKGFLLALSLWHEAIEKAAKGGRNSVRHSELKVVRENIPLLSKKAAIDKLAKDGFIVKGVTVCPGILESEVSW